MKELNAILAKQFDFDHFRWQQDNSVKVSEPFRADGLNRVLYKCPKCGSEDGMKGSGTHITCRHCGNEFELSEYGVLKPSGDSRGFEHIPDWYRWERECVRKELVDNTYRLEIPVLISMLVDTNSIYNVGEGVLTHTRDGFHLTGCDGRLEYFQDPMASYSLYADYYWYEIGDVICIGDERAQYYCFPKSDTDVVAKTRLACEELYKLRKAKEIV